MFSLSQLKLSASTTIFAVVFLFLSLSVLPGYDAQTQETENVYHDPAGRFSLPLVGQWHRLGSDESFAQFKLDGFNLRLSVVSVAIDENTAADVAAFQLIGFDQATLTEEDTARLDKWSVIFYAQADGIGVTSLCQREDSAEYCLIVSGDAGLTRNPPSAVMGTIRAFSLASVQRSLPTTIAAFETYMDGIVGDSPPGLSVIIAAGEDVLYAKGFGKADGPAGIQATPDTVFMWASMTKMVTATAIMQLVDRGLVELDAQVSQYLDYVPSDIGITVRQLLSHSSGLSEPAEFILGNLRLQGQQLPDPDLVTKEYFSEFEGTMFEPGLTSSYSTPGVVVLGQIVAQVSGQSFIAYARKHILIPLGMVNTDNAYNNPAMMSKASAPALPVENLDSFLAMIDGGGNRNRGRDFVREADESTVWLNRFSVFGAGSSLIGPPTEVMRFVQMHMLGGVFDGVRILSPESVSAMQKMQLSNAGDPLGWGLGWAVDNSAGHKFVEHDGGGTGMSTKMRIYPEQDVAIVLMGNSDGWDMAQVANAAANVVFTMMAPEGPEAAVASQDTITELPPVIDGAGNIVQEGFASLERVMLGGIEQTILIRTQDTSLPVLLFLHGGPGGSVLPWVDLFHTPLLEENFTVVHWDQRGAGASYNPNLSVDDISPKLLVADTLELSNLLRQRFDQDKIFLSGQSWGSALGFLTLATDSSPFLAFIPISERVAWNRSMTMGFNWVLDQSETNGDSEILAKLKAIEPFDPLDESDLVVQRQALDFYHAGDYHTPGLWDQYLNYAMSGQSPYYTSAQIEAYLPGMELSSAGLELPEIIGNYDLFSSYPAADIPVHFITGVEDHNTSGDLAFEYYEAIEAPGKSFTWIDGAAHMVMYDQPQAWAEAMVKIKDLTLENQGITR